ncbi:NAD(P)-dependent oxidoreductase [Mycobacterium sp. pW049]|uniref:NAD(P)-dependent oxidoreductase n=1 Tax=[Mycobacterium] bulgaricum TaxID=3238985 RepID=UPI00351BBBC7
MDVGFVGLGNMGFPMMSRLVASGMRVTVFDTDAETVTRAVQLGAESAESARGVADRAETVLASLPTPQVSNAVAAQIADGSRVRRFVDLSTVGQQAAQRNCEILADRGIAALDAPVSGGVHGAEAGTLAVMVSGPRDEFEVLEPVWATLGRVTFVSERPGAAQTMKLINNLIAATTLAVTAEAVVMGTKAGLDAQVMIDVLNTGSGATHASRDKFPRAVLPRTFDYGFATGLMTKDVLLYLDEAQSLGTPVALAESVAALWRETQDEEGSASDFTSVVKPMERAAGVTVNGG